LSGITKIAAQDDVPAFYLCMGYTKEHNEHGERIEFFHKESFKVNECCKGWQSKTKLQTQIRTLMKV
jgi:hypothetical protein